MAEMKTEDLTEVPVRLFKLYAQIIAKHDLWDELEEHLKSKGCEHFHVSAQFMEIVGLRLQHKISTGTLPKQTALMVCGFCTGGGGKGGGSDAGKGVPLNNSPGIMQPGTSPTTPVGTDGGTDGGTD